MPFGVDNGSFPVFLHDLSQARRLASPPGQRRVGCSDIQLQHGGALVCLDLSASADRYPSSLADGISTEDSQSSGSDDSPAWQPIRYQP